MLDDGLAPDGTRVVSTENLERTWEPQVPVAAETDYGLGWLVDEYKGRLLVHHGGNTTGFTAELAFLPDADLGLVVLTNGELANLLTEAVRFKLLELAFDQEPEFEEQVAFTLEQSERLRSDQLALIGDRVDPATAEHFAGRYENEVLGDLTLTLEDDALILDAGEFRSELRPVLDDAGDTVGYNTVEPPVLGLVVQLRDVFVPVVVVVDRVSSDEYLFAPIATTATPIASPSADS
jgi:hypothetical protein